MQENEEGEAALLKQHCEVEIVMVHWYTFWEVPCFAAVRREI